jgi:hypothetical protein
MISMIRIVIRALFFFFFFQNKNQKNRNSTALSTVMGINRREGMIRKPAIHNEGAEKSFS